MLPTHRLLPQAATGYDLSPGRAWVTAYLPRATKNLFTNPSFEFDTSGWSTVTATISRTSSFQFRGAWACTVTPIATTASGIYGSMTRTQTGIRYAVSGHVRRTFVDTTAAVRPDQLRWRIQGQDIPVQDHELTYVGDGWWRVETTYTGTAASTAAPGILIVGPILSSWYMDALQWEEQDLPTTYCDGDEEGLVPGEAPPAYQWLGQPHASESIRSGTTRAGGVRVRLDQVGFQLTALTGLGLPPQENQLVPFAASPGSQWQGARLPSRTVAIAGAIQATSLQRLDQLRADLRALFALDTSGTPQPIRLELQRWDGPAADGVAGGDAVTMDCVYTGGLDETTDNRYQERMSIQVLELVPGLRALASRGLTITTAVAVATSPELGWWDRTSQTWTWDYLSMNGAVNAIVFGPDGKLYAGGAFTTPGNRVARYNFTTAAWETLSTGLAGTVRGLAFDRRGYLWAVGDSGMATTSSVAVWNGSSWSAVGTYTDTMRAVALGRAGADYMYYGGDTGGHASLYRATLASPPATATITTGSGGGQVSAIAADLGGQQIYVGGTFTNLGGVTGATGVCSMGSGTTVTAMQTGTTAAVVGLAVDRRGRLWAVGAITAASGITVSGVARWTGTAWETVPGVNVASNSPTGVAYDPGYDACWIMEQRAPRAGTIQTIRLCRDGVAAPLPMVLLRGGVVAQNGAYVAVAGFLVSAGSEPLPAPPAETTNPGTLPSPATAVAWQTVGSQRIHAVRVNASLVELDAQIIPVNEALTIETGPAPAVTSRYGGDEGGSVIQGSDLAGMLVPPGTFSVALLPGRLAPSTYSAWISWHPRYGALGDAGRDPA